MELGQEVFCGSSVLNMLPENDSLIPIHISSGGIQDTVHCSGVKIGSKGCGRRTGFGNREGYPSYRYDTEEVWEVLQSGQYKANYRMFFSECSREELIAYAEQLLRRAEWLNLQEQELFGTSSGLDCDGDATQKNQVGNDDGFNNDGMDDPSEPRIATRVRDINLFGREFGREFEEPPVPLVARSDTPEQETHHISDIDRSKSIGIASPLPVMTGMFTPMFESPRDLLAFGSIQMAPLSPTGAMLPSSNNPYAETIPYVVEDNASPLGLKETHPNSSIASLMGTMTEMIRRAKEGNNTM
eukprot:jgi/Picsp_1/6593/NSC_03936-R1_---NA---